MQSRDLRLREQSERCPAARRPRSAREVVPHDHARAGFLAGRATVRTSSALILAMPSSVDPCIAWAISVPCETPSTIRSQDALLAIAPMRVAAGPFQRSTSTAVMPATFEIGPGSEPQRTNVRDRSRASAGSSHDRRALVRVHEPPSVVHPTSRARRTARSKARSQRALRSVARRMWRGNEVMAVAPRNGPTRAKRTFVARVRAPVVRQAGAAPAAA